MHTVASLARHLGQLLGAPVQIAIGRNRGTPVRAKALRYQPFAKGGVHLTLHELFLGAPQEVHLDMAHWLRVGRRAKAACERLDSWIQAALAELPAKPAPRMVLQPKGLAYDLELLLEDLLEEELSGAFHRTPGNVPTTIKEQDPSETKEDPSPAVQESPGVGTSGELPFSDLQGSTPIQPSEEITSHPGLHLPFVSNKPVVPAITWGKVRTKTKQRSMRLGSYQAEKNLIRVHARLDNPKVPVRFVRYIVFHELLHAVHPSKKDPGGRWIHHTAAFRKHERTYPDYVFAHEWEQTSLFKVV